MSGGWIMDGRDEWRSEKIGAWMERGLNGCVDKQVTGTGKSSCAVCYHDVKPASEHHTTSIASLYFLFPDFSMIASGRFTVVT